MARRLRTEELEPRTLLSGAGLLGDALVVFQDDFFGPADTVAKSVPEVDLQRGGWQTAGQSAPPTISGAGQLLGGAANSFAALALPAAGPYAVVSISATFQVPVGDTHWVGLGFSDGAHALTADQSGPWVKLAGDGTAVRGRITSCMASPCMPVGRSRWNWYTTWAPRRPP